jgi:phage terminase large subunit
VVEFIRAPKSNRFVAELPSVPKATVPVVQSVEEQMTPFRYDPLRFVQETFAWGQPGTRLAKLSGPRACQMQVLEEIGVALREQADINPDSSVIRVAVSSGKGVGKTSLAAWAFLWHLACHRNSQTIATSVTGFQSHSRFWREVRIWRSLWTLREEFVVQSTRLHHVKDETWSGSHQTWSLDRPEAFQGIHEQYTAFIVDEASAVPDEILEVIESGMTDAHTFILYISNPTRVTGLFRECFREPREQQWLTFTIDSRDVVEVNQERLAEQLAACEGDEESAAFRRNVRGLFAKDDYDTVIPESILKEACERVPSDTSHERVVIAADIARMGANKTVFLVRQGARILKIQAYAKQEIDTSADRLMTLIDEYASFKPMVYCDGDGIGAGVADICNGKGYRVEHVRSAKNADENERFANKRAELWYRCRAWLKKDGCLNMRDPLQKALREQLANIFYRQNEKDKIVIESKEVMVARGVASPDIADSLVYSFSSPTGKWARAWGRDEMDAAWTSRAGLSTWITTTS